VNDIESPQLSSRDREVLTLLARGYTNQQAADELLVSVTTVKTYIRFAYRTIGVTGRTQAVVWGVRHGLAGAPLTSSSTTAVAQWSPLRSTC